MRSVFTLLLSFVLFSAMASQNRKVLIIGVDGTRSDAFQQANTPNFDSLIARGLFTYDAWHCGITMSGASWSTIFTGVWWNKHLVKDNNYTNTNFTDYPYFTTRAKEVKPNLKCVQIVEWSPLNDKVYNDSWDEKLLTVDGDADSTAKVAAVKLQDDSLDCLFVYFDAVDIVGHSSGFSATNTAYIKAIEKVDSAVGVVLQALYNRPNYATEDWLIMATTDHGGIFTGHGSISTDERRMWFIAAGKGVQHRQISAADPGTYNNFGLGVFTPANVNTTVMRQSPVHTDIAVTALHHLIYDSGINPETDTAWHLDGRSWLAEFTDVPSIEEQQLLTVYPNPSTNVVTVWLPEQLSGTGLLEVFDLSGKLITQTGYTPTSTKVNLYLNTLAKGTYLIRLKEGARTFSRKLVLQ
ncbi:MAG: alkaline phosphatase family protein [Chitinophagales bacterium]